jgi:hypothetical protein
MILDLFEFLSLFLLKSEDGLQDFLVGFFNNGGFKKSDQIKIITALRKRLTIDNLKMSINDEDKNLTSKKTQEQRMSHEYFIFPESEGELKLGLSHHNSSELVLYSEGITKLENYNTIKYLNKSKYYFNIVENQNYKYLRIVFVESEGIFLSIYSPFQKKIENFSVTNKQEIVIKFHFLKHLFHLGKNH